MIRTRERPNRALTRIADRRVIRRENLGLKQPETSQQPTSPAPAPIRPPVDGERRLNRMPTDAELESLPLLEPTTLEINDQETARLRRRLYALNRDNTRFRYRTMRECGLTMLWRLIRY